METVFNYISSFSLDSAHLALNMVWLGLALTILVGFVWRFARPNEAGIRYAAWWSVLAVVIAMPFLVNGTSGPHLGSDASIEEVKGVPVDSKLEQPTTLAQSTPIASVNKPDRAAMGKKPADVKPERNHSAISESNSAKHQQVMGSVEAETGPSIGSVLLGLLPMTLFLIWVGIACLLLMRLWSAHRRMVSIKRASYPLDFRYWPGLESLLKKERGDRDVQIRCSNELNLPVAAGLGHPVILIPDHLIEELTQPEFEAIVRHELAHIKRWDDWTKLAQKVLESVAFFNPAVRWIGRQLDLEREMACDEQVVQQTGDPTAYAQCLTRLAQLTTGSTTLLVPGALNGRKQIFKRIGSLLNRSGNPRKYGRVRVTAFILSVLAAMFFIVQVAPVIAVPGKAVTLDELRQTIQTLMPDEIEAEPKEVAEVVEPIEFATTENSILNEPPQTEATLSQSEPISEKSNESEDVPKPIKKSPESSAEIIPPSQEAQPARVFEWDNFVFNLPFSGTIHGVSGEPSTVVWTSDNQKNRVALQGEIRFGSDNRSIKSIPKNGFVAIKWFDDDSESAGWEVDITRGKGGKPLFHYFLNGISHEETASNSKWTNRILRRAIPDLRNMTGSRSNAYIPAPPAEPAYFIAPPAAPAPPSAPPAPPAPPSSSPVPSSSQSDQSVWYSGYSFSTDDSDDEDNEPRIYAASGSNDRRDRGLVGDAWDWTSDFFDDINHGTSHMIDDGHHRIRWSDGRTRIQVEFDGEIEFTDDDSDIKSISRRGYIAIQEKRGSKRREIEIEPNADGSLDYIYELNGQSHDFDDDTKEWLADIIQDIIRNSAVGASDRVQRIYAADGVDGVIQEMLNIESDYVKAIYFQELADIDGLTENDYAEIITEAGQQLDSDYEKAEFLINLVDKLKEDPALKKLFVDAVGTVDSDYEKRRILSELTLGGETDPELLSTVLVIADEIDSDYEKAELLIELAPVVTSDSALLAMYVDAVESIDSDYETRRVLSELAFDDDVDESVVLVVLRIARKMDSDYEKAELLIDMAPYSSQYALAREAYVNAIRNTDSDYETRRIISALSNKRDLDSDAIEDLLLMAEEMDSDYEKAELLIELSDLCEDDTELLTTMMRSTATLDSDYESRRVLSSLKLDCETQPELTERMLDIVEKLDSDYETAELLIELAECAAKNEQFRTSYLRVADNLDGDYERKRVLTELIDESDELDSAMIVDILATIEDMDSDYEKGELLTELAPHCRGNDFLEEAYTDVVETMDSDFEIDRAYSRLFRRSGRSGSDRSY